MGARQKHGKAHQGSLRAKGPGQPLGSHAPSGTAVLSAWLPSLCSALGLDWEASVALGGGGVSVFPNREASQCEPATAVCPLPEAPKTYLLMEEPQPITLKHPGLPAVVDGSLVTLVPWGSSILVKTPSQQASETVVAGQEQLASVSPCFRLCVSATLLIALSTVTGVLTS